MGRKGGGGRGSLTCINTTSQIAAHQHAKPEGLLVYSCSLVCEIYRFNSNMTNSEFLLSKVAPSSSDVWLFFGLGWAGRGGAGQGWAAMIAQSRTRFHFLQQSYGLFQLFSDHLKLQPTGLNRVT